MQLASQQSIAQTQRRALGQLLRRAWLPASHCIIIVIQSSVNGVDLSWNEAHYTSWSLSVLGQWWRSLADQWEKSNVIFTLGPCNVMQRSQTHSRCTRRKITDLFKVKRVIRNWYCAVVTSSQLCRQAFVAWSWQTVDSAVIFFRLAIVRLSISSPKSLVRQRIISVPRTIRAERKKRSRDPYPLRANPWWNWMNMYIAKSTTQPRPSKLDQTRFQH